MTRLGKLCREIVQGKFSGPLALSSFQNLVILSWLSIYFMSPLCSVLFPKLCHPVSDAEAFAKASKRNSIVCLVAVAVHSNTKEIEFQSNQVVISRPFFTNSER